MVSKEGELVFLFKLVIFKILRKEDQMLVSGTILDILN